MPARMVREPVARVPRRASAITSLVSSALHSPPMMIPAKAISMPSRPRRGGRHTATTTNEIPLFFAMAAAINCVR